MNALGKNLLAGSRFTGDQYRRIGNGKFFGHADSIAYRLTGGNDVRKMKGGDMASEIDLLADCGFPLLDFSSILKSCESAGNLPINPNRDFIT